MKKIKVEVTLWEKGDRVITPNGIGTVHEDEQFNHRHPSTLVLFDKGSSHYPNGEIEPIQMDSSLLFPYED